MSKKIISKSIFGILSYWCFLFISAPGVFAENTSIIRTINVQVKDIFEKPGSSWVYNTANALKISTREKVIRRELSFKEGEIFDQFKIDESERNLRRLVTYVVNPAIIIHRDGDFVDVDVIVQDTWTLFPFIRLTVGGGTNKSSVGISESNFLGNAQRIEGLIGDDEGRQRIEGVISDRRFMGTPEIATIGMFQRTDGYRAVGLYGRPFRTLVDDYAWNTSGEKLDLVGRLFENGQESYLYKERKEDFAANYAVAFGEPIEGISRLSLGFENIRDSFDRATTEDFKDANVTFRPDLNDPNGLPGDRKFVGPTFGAQRIEPDYFSSQYLDAFSRVQDVNLGLNLSVRVQTAAEAIGSLRDTLLSNFNLADGVQFEKGILGKPGFLKGGLTYSSRLDREGFQNTIYGGDLRAYNPVGKVKPWGYNLGIHTFVAGTSLRSSVDLDRDRQILIGSGTGLRGYKDRAFSGEHAFLMNLEDRFHIANEVFKVVDVGGAFFADMGSVSDNSLTDSITDNMKSDIGFGLRLAFPRSAGNTVFRLDVAFPTRDGEDGTQAWEPRLNISTGLPLTVVIPEDGEDVGGNNVTINFAN